MYPERRIAAATGTAKRDNGVKSNKLKVTKAAANDGFKYKLVMIFDEIFLVRVFKKSKYNFSFSFVGKLSKNSSDSVCLPGNSLLAFR